MAFLPLIPQANDKIKQSRAQIQTNFQDIADWTAVDHETFGTQFEGTHAQVTFNAQAVAAPVGGQVQLHADVDAATGDVELFVANGDSGLTFPLTAASFGAQGYTYLPGGLILKWGNVTHNNATGGPFDFIFPNVGNSVAFTTILAAWAVVGAVANPATDVNAVAYVTNILDPTRVTYRIWRRNLFNTPGSNQFPYDVWILAVGF